MPENKILIHRCQKSKIPLTKMPKNYNAKNLKCSNAKKCWKLTWQKKTKMPKTKIFKKSASGKYFSLSGTPVNYICKKL